MPLKPVLKLGNPLLRKPAAPVADIHSAEVKQLITDLFDTMQAVKGAGLSAPQIGVSLQVMIFGFKKSERYPNAEPVPTTVIINPKLEILTTDVEAGWEGCVSVPGLRGVVERPIKIRYQGINEHGETINRIAEGFHARVFQHEYDHLQGILFPYKLKHPHLFGFEDEPWIWKHVIKGQIPKL